MSTTRDFLTNQCDLFQHNMATLCSNLFMSLASVLYNIALRETIVNGPLASGLFIVILFLIGIGQPTISFLLYIRKFFSSDISTKTSRLQWVLK